MVELTHLHNNCKWNAASDILLAFGRVVWLEHENGYFTIKEHESNKGLTDFAKSVCVDYNSFSQTCWYLTRWQRPTECCHDTQYNVLHLRTLLAKTSYGKRHQWTPKFHCVFLSTRGSLRSSSSTVLPGGSLETVWRRYHTVYSGAVCLQYTRPFISFCSASFPSLRRKLSNYFFNRKKKQ